jgi:hypothetical protein
VPGTVNVLADIMSRAVNDNISCALPREHPISKEWAKVLPPLMDNFFVTRDALFDFLTRQLQPEANDLGDRKHRSLMEPKNVQELYDMAQKVTPEEKYYSAIRLLDQWNDEYIKKSSANVNFVQSSANVNFVQSRANENFAKECTNTDFVQSRANENFAKECSNTDFVQSRANENFAKSNTNENFVQSKTNENFVQGKACKNSAQGNVQGTEIDKKYLDWKMLKINAAKVELDLVKQELCFKELDRIMERLYADIKNTPVFKKILNNLKECAKKYLLVQSNEDVEKNIRKFNAHVAELLNDIKELEGSKLLKK